MPQYGDRFSQVTIPQGVVLPYYARPDLAFQFSDRLIGVGTLPQGLFATVDYNIEIPLVISVQFATGPAVANRLLVLTIADNNGIQMYSGPSPVVFAENSIATVSWTTAVKAAFGSSGTDAALGKTRYNYAVPLTSLPLYARYTINISNQNFQGDEVFTAITYTRIRIPTGPPLESEVRLTPTPLLV